MFYTTLNPKLLEKLIIFDNRLRGIKGEIKVTRWGIIRNRIASFLMLALALLCFGLYVYGKAQ